MEELELISEKEWKAQLSHHSKIKNFMDLKTWFDSYYAKHEQKYNQLIALNKLDDNGENPADLLNALYEEAEIKRKQIQELEGFINGE